MSHSLLRPSLFRILTYTGLLLGFAYASVARAEDGKPPLTESENRLRGGATREESCKLELLRELGWEVSPAEKTAATFPAKSVCHTSSTALSDSTGLHLGVSEGSSAAEISGLRDSFSTLLEHPETLCGYKRLVSEAAVRAAAKLTANRKFKFAGLQWGFVKFGRTKAYRHQGWKNAKAPLKFLYTPKDPPSKALEQFYFGKVRSECAVGLQAAEMAMAYELFGAEDFDEAFSPEEMVIGTFKKVRATEKVFHGDPKASKNFNDRNGKWIPKRGALALVGYSGYIGNVLGEKFLDSRPNRGENFLLLSATEAAAAVIAKAGSFVGMNTKMMRAWEVVRDSADPKKEAKALYDDRLSTLPDAQKSETHRAVDAILSSPEFTQIGIFVQSSHAEERISDIRYHVKRLLKLNPRTPYQIRLYESPIEGEVFSRFKETRMQSCLGSSVRRHR